jgi:hypothetical protein
MWGLVFELSEPGVQVGRRCAVGDLNAGCLNLPLGLLETSLSAQLGPKYRE